jgi:ribosomal protein S18 acetylase RimI-like enzyme
MSAIPQTTDIQVNSATPGEKDHLIATIVVALAADPLMRWMCPEPLQFLRHWPSMAETYSSRSFDHGTADYATDYAGAAIWLPPDVHPDGDALVTIFLEHIAEDRQERLFRVLEQMAANQPAEPHWHLLFIGVDPGHQNRGIGSALMTHALKRCDRDNAVAYVESSSQRNLPFYLRHGFAITGEISVAGAPTLWPMVRTPGSGELTL